MRLGLGFGIAVEARATVSVWFRVSVSVRG